MNFEIDVSGSDLFVKNYTIVVAESNNSELMLAHKFNPKTISIIRARFGQGKYRYPNSKKGIVDLKIRLYCVSIFFIFKEFKKRFKFKEVNLDICRDFSGNEVWIKQSLNYLLENKLGLLVSIRFTKLGKESVADNYAFLIRHDHYKKLDKYCVKIKVEEFEEFLKK